MLGAANKTLSPVQYVGIASALPVTPDKANPSARDGTVSFPPHEQSRRRLTGPLDRHAAGASASAAGHQRPTTNIVIKLRRGNADNAGVKYVASCVGILLLAACSSPATLAPSQGPWRLSGTIFAMEGLQVGAPVGSARLTVASAEQIKAVTTSDASGRYVLDGLETGQFTLTVSAPGFITLTPTVHMDRDIQADFAIRRE
jgi:hypothetical protein